jgi:hypothetical protein
VIQNTAPTDTSVVWVDLDDDTADGFLSNETVLYTAQTLADY